MQSVHFSQSIGQHLFIIGNIFKSGKEEIETGHFNKETHSVTFFPPVGSVQTEMGGEDYNML